MILGAILAGGQSRRFGSDKAVATWRGTALLDHAIASIRPFVDAIVICGRDWPGMRSLPDRPAPALGPLGGLNAALRFGHHRGFARIVTIPCDTPTLPAALIKQLVEAKAAAVVDHLPVAGTWPSSLSGPLDRYLERAEDRSLRGWAATSGAVLISSDMIPNINFPIDLDGLIA